MEAIERALNSLYGLWIGDAFGGNFEFEHVDWKRPKRAEASRELPSPTWRYTDDTQMALSIYDVLKTNKEIQSDLLAKSFVENFDISRGYGLGAEQLLQDIQNGGEWQKLSTAMFDWSGSFGNGSAMRVAPIGAHFCDDIQAVVENARRSSIVTHTHIDAIAGAISVALASAQTSLFQKQNQVPDRTTFWQTILENTPDSQVKEKIRIASTLGKTYSTQDVAKLLGSGWNISAVDTVPFALWCAITHIDDFEEALWQTISVGGDTDTTGAIVGGIVASYQTRQALPQKWIDKCEPLPIKNG